MSKKLHFLIPALLAGMWLSACEPPAVVNDAPSEPEAPPENNPPEPAAEPSRQVESDAAAAVTPGLTDFGFDLYAALRDREDGNLVVSPLSVATALGMLLAGTVDEAEQELLAGLHLQDAGSADTGLSELSAALHARGETDGITVAIANRSFVQDGYPVRAEFLETLARRYGDAMESLDFAANPEAARASINQWVAEQTNDLIDELLQPGTVDPLTRLMLVNAVYLLADWDRQFDEANTGDEPFHLADGSTVEVPMMRDTRSVPVAVGDGYRAVELAYVGEELAMLIIVPDDLGAFERELDAESIDAIADRLASREVALWLPKVETRSNATLNDALAAIGIRRIFEPDGGWLTGIADDRTLYVSDVIHETYLRMDEEGTEAAAATAIGIRTTAMPPPPLELRVDRPYFLVLRDRPTGAVLFLGRIVDPR